MLTRPYYSVSIPRQFTVPSTGRRTQPSDCAGRCAGCAASATPPCCGELTGFYADSGATSLAYFAGGDDAEPALPLDGTIDPAGVDGGPAISNPADYQPVYSWTTYPERLPAAGVSWQVYANDEVGDGFGEDGYVGDYGDNPLWLFHAPCGPR